MIDETDRIVDEVYRMVIHQREGCLCGICNTMFLYEHFDLLDEIMDDMKTPNTGSGKQ